MGTYSNDEDGFVSNNRALANRATNAAILAGNTGNCDEARTLDVELIEGYAKKMKPDDIERAKRTIRAIHSGERDYSADPFWKPWDERLKDGA